MRSQFACARKLPVRRGAGCSSALIIVMLSYGFHPMPCGANTVASIDANSYATLHEVDAETEALGIRARWDAAAGNDQMARAIAADADLLRLQLAERTDRSATSAFLVVNRVAMSEFFRRRALGEDPRDSLRDSLEALASWRTSATSAVSFDPRWTSDTAALVFARLVTIAGSGAVELMLLEREQARLAPNTTPQARENSAAVEQSLMSWITDMQRAAHVANATGLTHRTPDSSDLPRAALDPYATGFAATANRTALAEFMLKSAVAQGAECGELAELIRSVDAEFLPIKQSSPAIFLQEILPSMQGPDRVEFLLACGEFDCNPDEAGNPQKCPESVLWSLALTELQTLAYDQSVGARARAALAKLGKPVAEPMAPGERSTPRAKGDTPAVISAPTEAPKIISDVEQSQSREPIKIISSTPALKTVTLQAPIAESSAKEVPTNPLLVALFMGCALAVIGLVAFILKQR